MKTIHATTRAKAQQAIEDAQAARLGYEPEPSQIMTIDGPDDQQIDCLLEDIEEYGASMDADDESQEALNKQQYDMLVENTADTDAFTGFLEWLKAEERIAPPPDDRPARLAAFAEQVLDILQSEREWGADTTDQIAAAAIRTNLADANGPDSTFRKL